MPWIRRPAARHRRPQHHRHRRPEPRRARALGLFLAAFGALAAPHRTPGRMCDPYAAQRMSGYPQGHP